NPCSVLKAPQGAAAPTYHLRGTVTYDNKAAAGYLIIAERDEAMSHHFFANRATSGATGAYDLVVAPGQYRVQVWYPTLLSVNDTARDPLALQASRRALSMAAPVAADQALGAVEMAYHDYNKLAPRTGAAKLPVTFQINVFTGGRARAAVYGGKNLKNIGDPWFASAYA